MRIVLICVVLVGCGSPVPMDSTLPLTEETCESKLFKYSDIITELTLDRDMYKAQAQEYKELSDMYRTQVNALQESLEECNILTSVYNSQLLNTGCLTRVADDGN